LQQKAVHGSTIMEKRKRKEKKSRNSKRGGIMGIGKKDFSDFAILRGVIERGGTQKGAHGVSKKKKGNTKGNMRLSRKKTKSKRKRIGRRKILKDTFDGGGFGRYAADKGHTPNSEKAWGTQETSPGGYAPDRYKAEKGD